MKKVNRLVNVKRTILLGMDNKTDRLFRTQRNETVDVNLSDKICMTVSVFMSRAFGTALGHGQVSKEARFVVCCWKSSRSLPSNFPSVGVSKERMGRRQ